MRKPRVIPDEDHEVIYERVAAVDVAKASGVVCMRPGHQASGPVRQPDLGQRAGDPGADRRAGPGAAPGPGADGDAGEHVGLLEDLVLRAGKHRAGGAAGVRVAGQEPERAAEDGPVDRTSGPIFGVVRAESGDAG